MNETPAWGRVGYHHRRAQAPVEEAERVVDFEDPLAALTACYDELRGVRFSRWLQAVVSTHEAAWASIEDEASWRLGRIVAAEVHDYFGDYAKANAALNPTDGRIQRTIDPHQRGEDPHKRGIWLTISFAHVRYRLEDYEAARLYLDGCLARLNALDPECTRFFGTRARLSYSLGQVARQRQQYELSLRHFADVCEYAAERFREKTGFLELAGPPDAARTLSAAERTALERERLLATWTIGKSLAFGVGWIHYTTGNLRVARLALNSGYSLLRSTGDWIHRAYAQLLLAATARALGGGGATRLERSLSRVHESERGLAEHPAFRGRATYERALGHLHMGDPSSALEAIATARAHFQSAKATMPKATRWICSLHVLESRAYRLLGQPVPALKAAAKAVSEAERGRHVASRIDALTARAEVLLEQAAQERRARPDVLGRAVSDLRDAQALLNAHPNPKMEAACWLHLARAHFRMGNLSEARQDFGIWLQEYADRVQHGFLHHLAIAIAREIGASGQRFIVPSTIDELTFDRHEARLRAFLIKTASERARTLQEQAGMLGVHERRLRQLIAELGTEHDIGKRLGRQRKP